jgi:hypothetical protein
MTLPSLRRTGGTRPSSLSVGGSTWLRDSTVSRVTQLSSGSWKARATLGRLPVQTVRWPGGQDHTARPGLFDRLQLGLVVSALVIDVMVLLAITGRITEWGFSPNKTAALGENLILLANLAWSAWLFLGFLRNRMPFTRLETWQTRYIIVYAAWTWTVVLAFP